MRILLVLFLVPGIVATATAQAPPQPRPAVRRAPAQGPPPQVVRYTVERNKPARLTGTVRVVASEGALRAVLPAATAPYKTDWPLATVPARGLTTGVDPTVPEFRIRAWEEGEGVRVLVFTATASGPEWEVREQQIASVLVPIDEFVEVEATEQFRARRLTLTAYRD